VLALASSPFLSGGATSEEVRVHGQGENPARWLPMLTTATPTGVVPSLGAWPWPRLFPPLSDARGNPRSGLPVRATVSPLRHSLLEDVVLATGGVLTLARMGVDVLPGVGCYLERGPPGRNVHHADAPKSSLSSRPAGFCLLLADSL
jgi:hypothetical protein